jgi:hypothetical protein
VGTAHQQASLVQDSEHNQVPREPSLWDEENTEIRQDQRPLRSQTHEHMVSFSDIKFHLNFKQKNFEIFATLKELISSP